MNKLKKRISLILLIVGLIAIVYSLSKFIKFGIDEKDYGAFVNETETISPKISEEDINNPEIIQDYQLTHDELLALNEEYRGWIRIDNTKIDFPIVQGADNEYYLTHNYKKAKASFGSIFMDFRVQNIDDMYLVMYGHSVNYKAMFGFLNEYRDAEYFKKNPEIKLLLNDEIRTYEIISMQLVDANQTTITLPQWDEIALEESLRANSLHSRDVRSSNVQPQFISLVTCEYSTDNGRIFLNGKLISVEKLVVTE